MKHEAWFFIGLFVFIFVIWIALGGPTRAPAVSLPTLPSYTGSSSAATSTGSMFFALPRAPFGIGGTEISLPGSSSGGGYGYASGGGAGRYAGVVTLDYHVSGAGSSDPRAETVGLYISSSARGPVDLTGWKLVSRATGRSGIIGRGVEVAKTGVVNATSDLILDAGDRAIIASGPSPIGVSFKENECTGYLGQYQFFSPPLEKRCPDAQADVSANITSHAFDSACQNAIADTKECDTPGTVTGASHACQNAINAYLNYNGCVALHKDDYSFESTAWRIYLWSAAPLFDPDHDTVVLLDSQGTVEDSFSY